MKKVYFNLGGKRRLGIVIQPNIKTIQVKVMVGAYKSIIVKRHRIKHNVKFYNGI